MLTQKQILETESKFLLGSFLAKVGHLEAVHGTEDFIKHFKGSLSKDGEPTEVVSAFENFIRLYLK